MDIANSSIDYSENQIIGIAKRPKMILVSTEEKGKENKALQEHSVNREDKNNSA